MTDPLIGVIMGSDSDWSVMSDAGEALREFDVPFEAHVVSAHRMPTEMASYAGPLVGRGIDLHAELIRRALRAPTTASRAMRHPTPTPPPLPIGTADRTEGLQL